jgi:hypothetical protein
VGSSRKYKKRVPSHAPKNPRQTIEKPSRLAQIFIAIFAFQKPSHSDLDEDERFTHEFYNFALLQAKLWFLVSLIGSVAGVIIFIYITLVDPERVNLIGKAICGVVAVLLIRREEKVRKNLAIIYGNIQKRSSQERAINLVKEINDQEVKDSLITQVILRLIPNSSEKETIEQPKRFFLRRRKTRQLPNSDDNIKR